MCAFCSTRKMVVPSRLRSRTILNISVTTRGASPSDGSSMSSTRGRDISAREQIFAHAHLREDEPVLGHERDAMRDDSGRRESDQFGAGEPDRAAARM